MNPNTIRHLVTLLLSMITAIMLGHVIGSGDTDMLFLLSYAILGIFLLTASGFVPLIAVGLLNPFILPIPFVHAVPFMLMILGICCVKLFFQNAISRRHRENYQHCFAAGSLILFGWVALRYCMNPVMPNVAGFGENVSGFRAYLQYGLCFALTLLLPLFVRSREDASRLLRWMGGISLFFILFLTPFVFSKSDTAALWLFRFGLYVTAFDNGWLRFVALPGFGLILITLALLPNLMPVSIRWRFVLGGLGMLAVVLGGNRSSLLMGFAIVLSILLVQRRIMVFGLMIVGIASALVAGNLIGERIDVRQGVGFLRILSVTSKRIANETDAAATLEWRMIRWRRAMQEIRNNPFFGKGYGGLENAWVFSDLHASEEARVEVDLASGGVHNGYLASAYSLGIPATLIFIFVLVSQVIMNATQVHRHRKSDPVLSDMHSFVFSNLVGLALAIYIGTDLNGPMIWFYIALGFLLTRLTKTATAPEAAAALQPIQPPLTARPMTG